MRKVLVLCNRAVSDPQFFSPSLPAEYVTAFSGRRDAPEVRRDLTDRHTDGQTNPTAVSLAVHAHRGLISYPYNDYQYTVSTITSRQVFAW